MPDWPAWQSGFMPSVRCGVAAPICHDQKLQGPAGDEKQIPGRRLDIRQADRPFLDNVRGINCNRAINGERWFLENPAATG
jgi:hypothetical protein